LLLEFTQGEVMDIIRNIIEANDPIRWLISAGLIIIVFVLLKFVKFLIKNRLKALTELTKTQVDDFLVETLSAVSDLFLFFVALVLGVKNLNLSEAVLKGVNLIFLWGILIQVGLWGTKVVSFFIVKNIAKTAVVDAAKASTANSLGTIAKVLIWVLVLLIALDSIPSIQVDSLIASLGIVGIAVGLAVQNILSDLFASLSITLDQPFVVGDYISIDDYSGTVEKVGLKSTRIRAISGEQLVFSNSDLLSSRIKNYQSRERRRVVFTIGVTYQASSEQLNRVNDITRSIISNMEDVTFDRVHFTQLNPSSLDFEVVYYVDSVDFLVYMDAQQKINLELVRQFAAEGIEFAYPTQTVFIGKNG
jgi:small-conductance mechanosensitive channel